AGNPTFGLTRIRCNLAGASLDIAAEFARRYTPNNDPQISTANVPASVAAGSSVDLSIGWDAASRETYPILDRDTHMLRDVDEVLRVSWYVSAGKLASASTGGDLDSHDSWSAPNSPGIVHLWIVLRDDRGGVDWRASDIAVN